MGIFETMLFVYFSAATLYVLVFSIDGRLRNSKVYTESEKFHKIAILVPAYKEDMVILNSVRSLLDSNYPEDKFQVVVIADSMKKETLSQLAMENIVLHQVDFEKSTKTKSLNHALDHLDDSYQIAMISDADNVTEADFLLKINDAFHGGEKGVQGKRVAKNLDTPFAVLDATSEVINNHVFRKGFNALGLSSAVIGSAMAFEIKLLKELLSKIQAVGGFDKELQLSFMDKGHKIAYLDNALVYDEKISSGEAFKNQRRRWFSSQSKYSQKYWLKGLSMLFRGNFSYFNIAVLYNLFPNRVFMIGSLGFIAILSSVLFSFVTIAPVYWWIMWATYMVALIIAIPKSFYTESFFSALLRFPSALFYAVLAAFTQRGADKKFIHTTHSKVTVNPVSGSKKKNKVPVF